MSTPAISAQSLYRFFHAGPEETLALRGVTLIVNPGEIVAIAGPSGSGKSTLLSCISGMDDPTGGAVNICGILMSRQPEPVRAALRRDRIGILKQSSELFSHLTVIQNVQLARAITPSSRTDGTRQTSPSALLELVGIAHRGQALPDQLSGGETARAGLAVALANDPAVLLADEPTGEVDRASERVLLDLLRALANQGMAVVLASHSPVVLAAADRVIQLADGIEVPNGR